MSETQYERMTRRTVFVFLSIALLWVCGVNHVAGWIDQSILVLRVIETLCAAIVGLSAYWWLRSGTTRTVFRVIVLLTTGIGIGVHIEAVARLLWLNGKIAEFDAFRVTWLWNYRQAGILIALPYLLAVVVSRMSDKKGYYAP